MSSICTVTQSFIKVLNLTGTVGNPKRLAGGPNVYTSQKISKSLLLTIGLILLIWYVQYLWKRRRLYILSWNIPGPFAFPFIGAAYCFLGSETSDIMEAIIKIQKKYPTLCKVWLGPRLIYFVSKPEHIEKILTSNEALNKDNLYEFLSLAIGYGLMTAKAPKWKKHRKAIRPAFNQKVLDDFQQIFANQSEIFADILGKYVGTKEINLFRLVSNCTLDIICETAMGLSMNLQTTDCDFGLNMDRLMEITTYRIFHIWHHLRFTWNLYPMSKEYARCLKKFKVFTESIVRMKIEKSNAERARKDSLTESFVDEKPKKITAFLDLLIENSNFTEKEVKEEIDIFLIAGTDTTASVLCCIFTMLGMFQDVQEKVYDEIIDIVGPDRSVLPSDLPNMKYTERFIKETLRIFPVAAFFARSITSDIDAGDVVFPAGSTAFFGPVHIQRNPKYWPDPLKFDPDRFLPENVSKRHPCTSIPFSYGPRNCIGAMYAMMNVKTVLGTVLRRYKMYTDYKSVDEIRLKTNIVLRMKDGPKVWIERR